MQRRFRKTKDCKAADVWVELGILRYSVELYEGGKFVGKKRGFLPRSGHVEVFLSGKDFASLVKVFADGAVRCTFSR